MFQTTTLVTLYAYQCCNLRHCFLLMAKREFPILKTQKKRTNETFDNKKSICMNEVATCFNLVALFSEAISTLNLKRVAKARSTFFSSQALANFHHKCLMQIIHYCLLLQYHCINSCNSSRHNSDSSWQLLWHYNKQAKANNVSYNAQKLAEKPTCVFLSKLASHTLSQFVCQDYTELVFILFINS